MTDQASRDQEFVRQVGANVRRLRRERGQTQEDLAHDAGLSARALGQIERGEATMAITTARRIAMALGVKAGELLGGAD